MTEAEPFEPPGPKIVYVNKAFEQRTGYSAAEVRGHGAGDELLRQIAQRLRGQLRVSAEALPGQLPAVLQLGGLAPSFKQQA